MTRILGLSRSGNHAIIDWILAQLSGRWLFQNCVVPEQDPFAGARPTDHGACHESNLAGFDPEGVEPGELDHLLFSQEDCFLRSAWGERATEIQESAIEQRLGSIGTRIDLLILRDPYNLFASRRRFNGTLLPEATALRVWKQHARAFLGLRTCLSHRFLAVSYNRWCRDPGYRQRLAEQLGLNFTDARVDAVPAVGGGSSFDGQDYHGQASRMAVHKRWRHFADDPRFRRLFDDQTKELAYRTHGPPPWEEQSLRSPLQEALPA
ncbi:hypothetical protein [Aquibaculum arenosum]|uniref:Sulfotransferase family protein n=1 Tax=Aquibaculum arenosum TaxID=3032591 RepID=A0ABT5YK84_9PROT|nr:hypothetical protein [Fodinicurvata sp. CAU 1616]MDF2095361.1 hypothetical protein [Fodinicurvata sp. CAU 1616]